jgi:hypothetical protein
MTALTRFLYPVPARRSVGSIIVWWERRRLAFNLVVGATGVGALAVVNVLVRLPPFSHGQLPPLGVVIAYGILANVCYTAGWVIESAAYRVFGDDLLPPGPLLFRQGVFFSVGLTLLPVVLGTLEWAARVLRWLW